MVKIPYTHMSKIHSDNTMHHILVDFIFILKRKEIPKLSLED